ncbi:hypothetical protein BKA81DRAFT_172748 [Phyllosticta paracitricarpa]
MSGNVDALANAHANNDATATGRVARLDDALRRLDDGKTRQEHTDTLQKKKKKKKICGPGEDGADAYAYSPATCLVRSIDGFDDGLEGAMARRRQRISSGSEGGARCSYEPTRASIQVNNEGRYGGRTGWEAKEPQAIHLFAAFTASLADFLVNKAVEERGSSQLAHPFPKPASQPQDIYQDWACSLKTPISHVRVGCA